MRIRHHLRKLYTGSSIHNPILPGKDPWVTPYKDTLLLIQSIEKDTAIGIRQFNTFNDLKNAPQIKVWSPPKHSHHSKLIWAPELHHFSDYSDKWYIYYSACNGNNSNHRVYVLESDTDNPLGTYHEKGEIRDMKHDNWEIDLTVLHQKGKFYAIWSGWDGIKGDLQQNLYIAPMSNPWTINGERILLSKPEYSWEMSVAPINEGPEVIKHDGNLFIIYSADASWTRSYKLGMLQFLGGHLLDPSNWQKIPHPVFQGKRQIFGPGHASFLVDSPGIKVPLIVYHSKKFKSPGWKREIRVQPFHWSTHGLPMLGDPKVSVNIS